MEVFKLELLIIMQIHLVFYTNFLSLLENDLFPRQKLEPQPSVIVADE